jgi:hypothetical protein
MLPALACLSLLTKKPSVGGGAWPDDRECDTPEVLHMQKLNEEIYIRMFHYLNTQLIFITLKRAKK